MEAKTGLKRIGIDIDDVLIDFLPNFLIFYNKKHGTNFSVKDFKTYRYCETLGGTNEDSINEVNEFCKAPEFDSLKPFEGCQETIKLLSKKYSIYAITSRPPWLKPKTLDFFQKYFSGIQIPVVHTGDFFGYKKRKFEICAELRIPLIIEDNGKYALECTNSRMYAILFNKFWNKSYFHNNLFRTTFGIKLPG